MTSLIFILAILSIVLLPLFFRRETKTEGKDQQLPVATLGRTGNNASERSSPCSFIPTLSQQWLRKGVGNPCRRLPGRFRSCWWERFRVRSLFRTALPYEEIVTGSGRNEYIQAFFYFPDGEDFFFQAPAFTYQDQDALYQALRLMRAAESYAGWEKAFYEY